MTFVALPVQVYQADGLDAPRSGLLGVVDFVPILFMAFVGGALADSVDRRRMVLVTDSCSPTGHVLLVVNSLLPEPRVWVTLSMLALFAAINGFQRPSLDALSHARPPELMPAATALLSGGGRR